MLTAYQAYQSRKTEGTGWNIVGEQTIDGIDYFVIESSRKSTRYIKKCDYYDTRRYIRTIPTYIEIEKEYQFPHTKRTRERVSRRERVIIETLKQNGGWMTASGIGAKLGFMGRDIGQIIVRCSDPRIEVRHDRHTGLKMYKYREADNVAS